MGFISDTWDSVTDEVSRGWENVTEEVSRGWEDYGKDIVEGSAIAMTGGLYYVGKKGYESYEAAKEAQEAAEKAQKEYTQQQKELMEEQKLAQEKEAESLRASVARTRRQAFAERSVTSSISIGVEEDPIYSTDTRSVGNTIPNIGGINI